MPSCRGGTQVRGGQDSKEVDALFLRLCSQFVEAWCQFVRNGAAAAHEYESERTGPPVCAERPDLAVEIRRPGTLDPGPGLTVQGCHEHRDDERDEKCVADHPEDSTAPARGQEERLRRQASETGEPAGPGRTSVGLPSGLGFSTALGAHFRSRSLLIASNPGVRIGVSPPLGRRGSRPPDCSKSSGPSAS